MTSCGKGCGRCLKRFGTYVGQLFSWLPSTSSDFGTFLGLPLMVGFILIDYFLLLKGVAEIIMGSLTVRSSGWDVTSILDIVLGIIQAIIALSAIPVPCTRYQRGIYFLALGLRLVLINIIFSLVVDTFSNGFRLAGVGDTPPWQPERSDWIVLGIEYTFNLLYVISAYWLISTVNSLRAAFIAGGNGWERLPPSIIYEKHADSKPQIFLLPSLQSFKAAHIMRDAATTSLRSSPIFTIDGSDDCFESDRSAAIMLRSRLAGDSQVASDKNKGSTELP